MTRQNGFTLIELMIALSLVTILVTMAVPGMQQFRSNARQTGTVNELVSGMRIARNTAITTNTRVTMCPSKNGESCQSVGWEEGWISFVDFDASRSLNGEETILRSGSGVDGVTIRSGQFSNMFVYRPNGRVMNANVGQNFGQFMICDDRGSEHAKAVMIDLSGRARVADDYYGGGLSVSCN